MGEYEEEEIAVLEQVLQNASPDELKELCSELCIDLDDKSKKNQQQKVHGETLNPDSAPAFIADAVAALKQKREDAFAAAAANGFKLPDDFDCGVLWTDPGLVISYFIKWKLLAKVNSQKFVVKNSLDDEDDDDDNDEVERKFADLQREENKKRTNNNDNNNDDDDSAATRLFFGE